MSTEPPDDKILPFRRLEPEADLPKAIAADLDARVAMEAIEAGRPAEHGNLSDADRAVIDDENAFQRRFGFDWPRQYRRKLLLLKHDLDLTDCEIQLLQRTRNFVLDPCGLRLETRRWHWWWGWAQIWCLGVFIAVPIALVVAGRGDVLATWQWLALALWAIGSYALGHAVFLFYVRPFQIQQRTRADRPVIG